MALPTAADLKTYLRIETTAEDALLAALMLRAKSMLETWIDTPILTELQTAIDRADGDIVTSLVFPRRPASVTLVVDSKGVTVPSANYWTSVSSAMIYANDGISFPYGPYTITAQVGLALRGDYGRLEPLLAECILDLAADLYQRRTPGAASETAAGTTVNWDAGRETVARIMKSIRSLRLGVGL
jgi:hypothetical protein